MSGTQTMDTLQDRWRCLRPLARLALFRSTMPALLVSIAAALVCLVAWRSYVVNRDNEALFATRATERANAIAAQLTDTIAATLAQADTMHGIARLLTDARLSGNTAAEMAVRPFLDPTTGDAGPDVAQVGAIAPSGRLLWTNLDWTTAGYDLSDREHVQALLTNANLGAFFGRPVLGRASGEWTVPYVRPDRDPAGMLRAITVVSLRATMLARLCRNIALAPDDTVTVLRDDGVVMMRLNMMHIGGTVDVAANRQRHLMESGLLSAQPSPLDGVPRYRASRRIPGTPLTLHVGLSQQAQIHALASVRTALWRGSLFLEATIVACAIAGGFAMFAFRRSAVQAARADSLAASEVWLRGMIDDMADGMLVLDNFDEGDFRIGFANRMAGEILGVPAASLAGRDFLAFVHPDDRGLVAMRRDTAMRQQKLDKVAYRALRPDGGLVWLETSSVIAPNPAEPVRLRVITTIRDITEEYQQEQELAAARARIDRILAVVPGVFYQASEEPGGTFVANFVSESVASILGITVEEALIPGSLARRVVGDLAAVRRAAFDKVGPSGTAKAEYCVRGFGQERWLHDTMRRLPRPDGGVDFVGFITDATAEHMASEARRTAETELQRSNRALAAYSRSLHALIKSSNLMELATRVCQGIVEESGYVLACVGLPEPMPGLPIRLLAEVGSAIGYLEGLELSCSADVQGGLGPTGIAFREGTPYIIKDTAVDPIYAPWRERGLRFGIRSCLTVPCKVNDQVLGVLLVYASEPNAFGPDELRLFERLGDEIGFAITLEGERDQLRTAETARAAAEENLRDAAQLGPGVLYRARVGAAGVEVLHMFGAPADEAPGRGARLGPDILDAVLGGPDNQAAIRSLATNGTRSDDIPLQGNGGRACWIRNAVRVTGRSGDAVEVVGYLSEVTEEKQQQLHHQQFTTLLTLGEMATGMAHELNQPLASISFAAQNVRLLLDREPADVRVIRDKLGKIVSEAGRASQLIHHMRVFARNERGELRPVSWHAVLESALEILNYKLLGFEVVKLLPDDLPSVLGSPIALEQVLINLISNAVDAYEMAAPEAVRVVKAEAARENDHVVLRIADRAGGIPPAALPRVFEPFFSTKPVGKGTGLGLALAFGTITEMGGTITAANKDGGAMFEIRLPMAMELAAASTGVPAHVARG